MLVWLSLEIIPKTVWRLFISSPFILIPQKYLVTIQGRDTEVPRVLTEHRRTAHNSQGHVEDSGHCTYSCKLVGLTLYSTPPPQIKKERRKEREGKAKTRHGSYRENVDGHYSPGFHTWRGADLTPEIE